ncbi:peptidase A2 [Comamonas serinivorans]|uniref:Peptidase A2 n=1 Tax=Comamonas serinivorans TaxID=1082851 RepID=A0A1Y0ETG9_9BURK|nr:peptidase A2 [Comamonas serinivorans]
MMGNKALLVVNGRTAKALSPGESLGSVQLVAVKGEVVTIRVDGAQSDLHLGETQASVAGGAPPVGGSQISMASDASGHFLAEGLVNGKPTRFMVDTGATSVAMSLADAVKLGVDYQKGRAVQVSTANGVAPAYALKLHSVRIGDVEVFDVDAVVTSQRMPYVLLGNSFLNRFQMRRDADILVLTRR